MKKIDISVFKSPGVYTIEHDITIVKFQDYYCIECGSKHTYYNDNPYLLGCGCGEAIVTKEVLRDHKINKLFGDV